VITTKQKPGVVPQNIKRKNSELAPQKITEETEGQDEALLNVYT
jgi:hypothetical protein